MINEMHDYCKPAGTRRLRFRDWLKQKLDNKEGAEWIDRSRGLFKIPWKHGSHRLWCVRYDCEIFKQWAIYSGKYTEGIDRPNPSKWKTNFRCTLNALPDFREVREKSCPRGNEAYKIYMMKSNDSKHERKTTGEKPSTQQSLDLLTDKEIVQLLDDMRSSVHSTEKQAALSRRPISAFPAFETLVVDRSKENFPHVAFHATPWLLAAWNAMAVDKFVPKPKKENDKGDEKDDGDEDSFHAFHATPWILAAWNAMAVDKFVPKPKKENDKSDEKDDGDEDSKDEVPSDQEIIDLVDQMSEQNNSSDVDVDGIEATREGTKQPSNQEEDEVTGDQEIIDLVEQMSEQSNSSL
ncbi:unnamed protein product [Porites evermanni]|uniref:IRF tryptophan pentad repeat domain-containing protein n=1 Tax=Porites evermanni TaxID=104178 RepID=A0ABN8LF46_9CNID|nr:unnamed protein product [Porites evermanni]